MKRHFLFPLSFILGIFIFVAINFSFKAAAQFPIKIPNKVPINPAEVLGIDDLLKKEPALSTSLEDAQQAIPFLDDYNPTNLDFLSLLPRTENNGFQVPPGNFELYTQSYCLRAGTYTPGSGNGYVYAPLKGKYADIIQHVLENSADHPEIPQRQVQTLLWAIIAETKIRDMPKERVQVAETLLTDDEIEELNGGALGKIPDRVKRKFLSELPPMARKVFNAKAEIRRLVSTSNSTFEELEEAAVLLGTPEFTEDSREVPSGRWSYHSNGYFIRYFPNGYKETRLQVSVPEKVEIQRDRAGRIAKVALENGNRIEMIYDDSVEPLSFQGDSEVAGYSLQRVDFYRQEAMPPERTLDYEQSWENQGWTLVGLPNGDGTPQATSSQFTNARDRYEQAVRYQDEQTQAFESLNLDADNYLQDLADLYHLQTAIKAVIPPNAPDWQQNHLQLFFKAWQYQLCQHAGQCQAMAYNPQPQLLAAKNGFFFAQDNNGNGNGTEVNPPGGAAQPGNTSRQRTGQSSRPQPEPEKQKKCQKLRDELAGLKNNQAAFANQGLRDRSNNGQEYNDNVKDFIKRQRESNSNDSNGDLKVGASTNVSSCEITFTNPDDPDNDIPLDEMSRDKWTEMTGRPGEIYDAYVAHEKVHRETCQRANNAENMTYERYMNRPNNYGKNEVDAYQASIDSLEDAIDRECGN
ncbi:MAG: hypothetical protein ABEI32_03920 [Halothece sp.]